MKTNEIHYLKGETTSIVISLNDVKGYVKNTLLILVMVCIGIPLLATLGPLIGGNNPHIAVIIMYLIFWGIAIFFWRLYLWHKYGKELITIRENEINYTPDYRRFKGSSQTIKNNQIVYGFVNDPDKHDEFCYLTISNPTDKIQSVIRLSNEQILDLIKKIET